MSGGGRRRVYLAGPDVFLRDAPARGEALRAICAGHGLEGVFPLDALDGGDPPDWAGLAEALRIARRNEAHIASCDALVANLTPFRGPSADAGTVFELGYMRALGRPVFGWSNTAVPFAVRSRGFCAPGAVAGADGAWRDGAGMLIEDFPGMADNLMIHGAILASGGVLVAEEVDEGARWRSLEAFARCIAAVARVLAG